MRRERLRCVVVTVALRIVQLLGVLALTIVLGQTVMHARAAMIRRRRREACPFEDDDDEARPLAREVVEVVRESVAHARAMAARLMPKPSGWRRHDAVGGSGPVVVLVAEHGFPLASLAPLGRRLARDLDATVRVAHGSTWDDERTRADRLADDLSTLTMHAHGRPLLAIGHGEGGLVARRAAAVLRLPALRVVTIATAHRAGDEPGARDPVVDRVDVLNVYSLHDATVVPAGRAYLPGAYNVALRDEGHIGMVLARRPYAILLEAIAGLLPRAAAS
jgi:hypothetical protein